MIFFQVFVIFSFFFEKKCKKIERKKCLGAQTPQRMRRFPCLQDCLLTLTCHLAGYCLVSRFLQDCPILLQCIFTLPQQFPWCFGRSGHGGSEISWFPHELFKRFLRILSCLVHVANEIPRKGFGSSCHFFFGDAYPVFHDSTQVIPPYLIWYILCLHASFYLSMEGMGGDS
jgi:hypothetical protein